MTGGSAQKAMHQRLAGRLAETNAGKDPAGRHDPGDKLGFPDLTVFTSEALDRIKAIAGDDSARTVRLSALVLEIAHREFALPVLPDLVDEAAAQLDLECAQTGVDGADAQPRLEHAAAPANTKPASHEGMPPVEPVDRPRPDPVRQTGNVASGVSASRPRPRRRARGAYRAIGVVALVAAGTAGALAYTGHLDTVDLGELRETATSRIAAIGLSQLGGQQQTGVSGDGQASSPPPRAAETEPPGGSAVNGDAAGLEDESEGDGRSDGSTDGRNDARSLADDADGDRDEAAGGGDTGWEENRRADEAALAERWPELEEAAEDAIKQRFREVQEQAEQARRALEAIGQEMDQLHRRQHEELQARHARERAEADAEGAGAVAQADERHQQERTALERDQKAERDRLAETYDELDRHLDEARRDVTRAREEAVGGGETSDRREMSTLHLHERSGVDEQSGREQSGRAASERVPAASGEEPDAADSVAAESGLQPQSDQAQSDQAQSDQTQPDQAQPDPPQSGKAGDRQSQASAVVEDSSQNPTGDSGTIVVAPEPAERQPEPLTVPQQAPSEPVVTAEPRRDSEEAAPPAGQPPSSLPSSPPSPVAGTSRDAPAAEDGAVGTAEAAESMMPEAARAAAPPGGAPASPRDAAPVSQDVADLLERGNALLDFGDLASARLFYQLAAGRGSAEGAMLMGMTYDPVYFAGADIHGTQPQIQDALEWYSKAIAMGSQPAETRMGQLRSWLEQSAAAGNAQAKAALQQLR